MLRDWNTVRNWRQICTGHQMRSEPWQMTSDFVNLSSCWSKNAAKIRYHRYASANWPSSTRFMQCFQISHFQPHFRGKLCSDGWMGHIHGKWGRIHGKFKPFRTFFHNKLMHKMTCFQPFTRSTERRCIWTVEVGNTRSRMTRAPCWITWPLYTVSVPGPVEVYGEFLKLDFEN